MLSELYNFFVSFTGFSLAHQILCQKPSQFLQPCFCRLMDRIVLEAQEECTVYQATPECGSRDIFLFFLLVLFTLFGLLSRASCPLHAVFAYLTWIKIFALQVFQIDLFFSPFFLNGGIFSSFELKLL